MIALQETLRADYCASYCCIWRLGKVKSIWVTWVVVVSGVWFINYVYYCVWWLVFSQRYWILKFVWARWWSSTAFFILLAVSSDFMVMEYSLEFRTGSLLKGWYIPLFTLLWFVPLWIKFAKSIRITINFRSYMWSHEDFYASIFFIKIKYDLPIYYSSSTLLLVVTSLHRFGISSPIHLNALHEFINSAKRL